jgi:NarL family two-component system response regulator LiaR
MVSCSTVKFHVSNVLSKLGPSSRAEAVALALQHDLVS